MNSSENMDRDGLILEIEKAFSDVPWLYESSPEILTPEATERIVDEFYLMSDEDKHYELPRALCVAITEAKPPLQERLLCSLIEFMDVDFFDPGKSDDLLKEAKYRIFRNYSCEQSVSVAKWLKFVSAHFALHLCEDTLRSATKYWNLRNKK
jgi:hypothetical protein